MRNFNELREILKIKKNSLDSELNHYHKIFVSDNPDLIKENATYSFIKDADQTTYLEKIYFLEDNFKQHKRKATPILRAINKKKQSLISTFIQELEKNNYNSDEFIKIGHAACQGVKNLIYDLKISTNKEEYLMEYLELKGTYSPHSSNINSLVLVLLHSGKPSLSKTSAHIFSLIHLYAAECAILNNYAEQISQLSFSYSSKLKQESHLSLIDKSNSALAQVKELVFNKKNIANEKTLFLKYFIRNYRENLVVNQPRNQQELNDLVLEIENQSNSYAYLPFEGFLFGKSFKIEDFYYIKLKGIIFPFIIKKHSFYDIKKTPNKNHIKILKDKIKSNTISKKDVVVNITKLPLFKKHKKFIDVKYIASQIELKFESDAEQFDFEDFASFDDFCAYYFYFCLFFKYCKSVLSIYGDDAFLKNDFIMFILLNNKSTVDQYSLYHESLFEFIGEKDKLLNIKEQVLQEKMEETSAIFIKDVLSFIRNSYSHKRFYAKKYYKQQEEIVFVETSEYGDDRRMSKIGNETQFCIKSKIVEINVPSDFYFLFTESFLSRFLESSDNEIF